MDLDQWGVVLKMSSEKLTLSSLFLIEFGAIRFCWYFMLDLPTYFGRIAMTMNLTWHRYFVFICD